MRATPDSLAAYAIGRPLHYLWGLGAVALIAVYTAILGPIAVLSVLLTGRTRGIDVLGRIWCRMILWTCGVRVDLKGIEKLRPGQSYVIISNHASLFDIAATIAAFPLPIRFVAKKELLKVPFFGPALKRSDHILIDRDDPQAAIQTIRNAVARSEQGVCILFYAEGTRSPDGKVRAFKKGGVSLAIDSKLPVVPLSVSGTRKLLPKGSLVVRPHGRIRLFLDDPIETAGLTYEQRDELNDRVRQRVIANYIEDF